MRRKFIITIVVLLMILAGCINKTPTLPQGINIFVAIDGDDTNDGSFKAPFLTFKRAQQEVRTLLTTSTEPITVNIKGGNYYLNDTISFTAEDSGTNLSPVTWQAYNGENVQLIPADKISSKDFVKVTDQSILDRTFDNSARENLYYIDFSKYIDKMPLPIVPNTTTEISDNLPSIYIDGNQIVPARWPNQAVNASYVYVDKAQQESIHPNYSVKITSSKLFERAKNWSDKTWEDLYLYSFISVDWADGIFDVKSYDKASQSLVVNTTSWDVPSENGRFYVLNLLEEIDLPYESYIDYENNTMYFYAPENLDNADIYFAYKDFPVFFLNNVQYLTLRGLTIAYTRSYPIWAIGAKNLVIDGLTIAHSSRTAIYLDDTTNSTVINCHIYDIDGKGIYIWDGGLRETLTPSNNLIENNHIHHVSRNSRCYLPPIMVNSMGITIRNNELHDIPHLAIDITQSNDAIIEYNEIYNAGLDTSDMGTIYYGRDPFIMGLTIRYNYFHDIGNTYGGYGQQAIFADDGTAMAYIYGNIFYNASDKTPYSGSPIKANGAQYGVVKNNIIIDSPTGADFVSWNFGDKQPLKEDYWLLQMYGIDNNDDSDSWKNIMEDKDPFSETWQTHYHGSQWEGVWDYLSVEGHDESWDLYRLSDKTKLLNYAYENAPMHTNIFENNICVNTEDPYIGNAVENNTYIGDIDIFVNYYNRDFRLTPEALKEIRTLISDFEEIPLEKIGVHPYFAYDKQCKTNKMIDY